ncbi:MAG: peroxiredoxin-like family protein [Phycisphaerales bacterium]|jgi:peroxiredoxin
MIVGVYGLGYWVAARDSRRHWPIVLVGFLGKILGPIGMAKSLVDGSFTPAFAINNVFNDLIWIVPFGLILWDAARSAREPRGSVPPHATVFESLRDQHGATLAERSQAKPLLVVFTRHAGCTFCREALAELATRRSEIERQGVGLAIVTMSDAERNANLANEFGLTHALWFSDPGQVAYRALELPRGRFSQLFGWRVWWPGLRATLRGHLVGKLEGDGFQMPGAFVVHKGRVVREFRHPHAAARPDYVGLACELPA